MTRCFFAATLLLITAIMTPQAYAGETLVAVATNFTKVARELALVFEKQTGHRVRLSFGSTGKIYAQVIKGAPFDLFLAADQIRPKKLADEGYATGEPFTYAIGQLVLYSATEDLSTGEASLISDSVNRIAIANPKIAPYGAAAIETLKSFNMLDKLKHKIVRGESVAQAYQFVFTKNAEIGFVARAQMKDTTRGTFWPVPENLHTPIKQDAIQLKNGANNFATKEFVTFLKGKTARKIILKAGYSLAKAKE